MLLSIETLARTLKDEVRDITMRQAVVETDRFVSHPQVRRAIIGALSEEHYSLLNKWLLSIANDAAARPSDLQFWDNLAHGVRTRTTMVGLGLRLSTMVMHGSTAALESVAEAGAKTMAKGLFNVNTAAALTTIGPEFMQRGLETMFRGTNFESNRDFIFEKSAEMRHRSTEFERDVREKLREIQIELMNPATSAVRRAQLAIQSRAYSGIAMLDMASAIPTWMGAYLKASTPEARGGLGLGDGQAVYFADKTVRNAHGGAGVKDMAAIQRGHEWQKLFTMFYTFWNHNVNRLMDTARRAGELPATAASGDWGKFRGDLGTVILRSMIYTLGVQAIHHMMHPPKDTGDPDSWLAWFGKTMASSAFGGIPIARDVAAHYIQGKDYEMSPVESMIPNIDAFLKDMEGNGKTNHYIQHASNVAGYLTGLPLGQVGASAQFLSDVWSGEQRPEDITDWWNGMLHGSTQAH
jgi:Spy/CpxP family protein refolding chaperone